MRSEVDIRHSRLFSDRYKVPKSSAYIVKNRLRQPIAFDAVNSPRNETRVVAKWLAGEFPHKRGKINAHARRQIAGLYGDKFGRRIGEPHLQCAVTYQRKHSFVKFLLPKAGHQVTADDRATVAD